MANGTYCLGHLLDRILLDIVLQIIYTLKYYKKLYRVINNKRIAKEYETDNDYYDNLINVSQ